MAYSNNEKAAIVSLLIEMINVNDKIDLEELYVMNVVNGDLGITQDIFEAGKCMDCNYAMTVVKHMSDEKKMNVAVLMTKVIDADGVVDNREIALLNKICEVTGIDSVINRQQDK